MKSKKAAKKPAPKKKLTKPGDQFAYPANEDIYTRGTELESMDVDDFTQLKSPNLPEGQMNEKSFRQDKSGDDLDVPGAELDDEAEETGNEDEENNEYSLGGDNHPD